MTACETRTTLPRCDESPFSSWSFVGILLVALVLLLPTFSDACDDPPRFQSMKLKGAPQGPYSPGDKIEYECRPGYMPLVPLLDRTAVCQSDNTWTPLQEACTRKSCPQLADPLNGQINGTFLFGSQAHYTCNEGFYLVGPAILHCELSGDSVAWSDEPPNCEKVLCKPPAKIPNGIYTNSHKDIFEYNEVVTYSCNPSNGPDEYSLVGESQLICSGQDKWSSEPPECKVVKCPYPALKNGELVSGFGKKYYYKAKVVLQCHKGFNLKGSDTIVCGADNTWKPEMPECIKVPTPPSTKPSTFSPSVSTPPSTKPPTSSPSVLTSPSTKPSTTSVSDVRPPPPAVPTTPPSHTGHCTLSETPPKDLDPGVIAGIVIGSLAAVAILGFVVYTLLKRKKKREGEISAAYSSYQDKSTTPAEQTH